MTGAGNDTAHDATALTTLDVRVADGIATVTLDRPERRNGITNRMLVELTNLLECLAGDRSVAVVVLTGAGRDFCVGADLKHYTDDGAAGSNGEAEPKLDTASFAAAVLLHDMPQVTIAAVNGACAGAGLGWAASCDLRYAARSAVFNTAFLDVAVAGDMGGPWSLTRLLGAGKARELYFLPGKFDAAEAERIGLVNAVFDDDAMAGEVGARAARIAGAAPLARTGMKANFLAAERLDYRDFIELESERHQRITSSRDTQEAFRAFVEKRTPHFEGR
ncbi:MAG: enoyl-CoA hydratase-related protein [Actinomycetota bacterium]|nr:enoyl-CoA hydratase-related protein [Actinomycetota bacterium]